MQRSNANKTAPSWAEASDDQLYSVADLDVTPLSPIPMRTRYALIADGRLTTVTVGDRHYVTKAAILDFLRRHTCASGEDTGDETEHR